VSNMRILVAKVAISLVAVGSAATVGTGVAGAAGPAGPSGTTQAVGHATGTAPKLACVYYHHRLNYLAKRQAIIAAGTAQAAVNEAAAQHAGNTHQANQLKAKVARRTAFANRLSARQAAFGARHPRWAHLASIC